MKRRTFENKGIGNLMIGVFFVILLFIFGYAILSRKIAESILSLPILFSAIGYGLYLFKPEISQLHDLNEVILTIAELTLILVLFSDASRINFAGLRDYLSIPARMLFIGMPMTIMMGTLLAHWVSPEMPWVFAVLVAAVLTPTDAALGQAVVTNKTLPLRIRQSINIESGLNDGLVVPVVTVAAIFTAQYFGTMDIKSESLTLFTLKQILFGPLAGIVIGGGGGYLLNTAQRGKWNETALSGLIFLSVALGAYLAANLIGGNGFIAAFIGGLVFGYVLKGQNESLFSFMESEGQLLTIIAFIVFGAVLLPLAIEHASLKTFILSIGFLTVVRVLPIWLSLLGTELKTSERLFLGWFGPRGLASILFSIIVIEGYDFPNKDEFLACVVLTVALSIILHGITARPFSQWLGRKATLS